MPQAAKDFAYYMANPEELPEDPEVIMKLAAEHADRALAAPAPDIETWSPPEKPEPEPAAAAPAAPEPAAPAAAPTNEPTKEEAPTGVLAKDGKNVIPYEVLQGSRERVERLEQLVADQATQIRDLQKKPEEVPKAEIKLMSDEELSAIKEEFPAFGAAFEAQNNAIRALLARSEESARAGEPTEEQIGEMVREAIDGNESLRVWEANDVNRYNKAVDFDAQLRDDPAWQDKTFAERFEKAVSLTKAYYGDAVEAPKPAPAPVVQKPEDISAAAAAKLKQDTPTPQSMSQIPGGAAPAQSEAQAVEAMSPEALGSKLIRMNDPDKIAEYIARM